MRASRYLIALLIVAAAAADSFAETGRDAWLRYQPLTPSLGSGLRIPLPTTVVVAGDGEVVRNAAAELSRGIGAMTGRDLAIAAAPPGGGAVFIGTLDRIRATVTLATPPAELDPEGFWIGITHPSGIAPSLVVAGGSERGALYGAFALLREMAQGHDLSQLNRTEAPTNALRWTNEWDNMDGSIERGYGGRSIFFRDNHVLPDLTRAGEYARLLASVGINACSVSNVNANPLLLTDTFGPELARLAAAFRPWGVRLAISVDFSSPKLIGGLDTFDPLDPKVAAFWKDRVDALYRAVPDLGGFVLKADSEGRLGPSAYGRTHADAANVIARALAPHHGVIFYRGFVYDHHMDWRNPKNDRARAAWDNFHDLDGTFDDNVVLQIKHGPIDFQAREPVSPLFGALEATNQAIELQITQEYTGQQRHICFLVPMWKEVLDFDLQADGSTPVSALVSGRHFKRPLGGFVGVSNVGDSDTWLGSDFAMANLYGFGRLAWNPSLTPERIADEWTRQTFGSDAGVVETTNGILLGSWPAYEHYTGPLGAQTLTDITGPHYGPGIESSENNGWGQWHRADAQGIGMDRTVATGTGYIGQYSAPVAAMYESLKTCPDDLLLFMHHVPYTYVLHSGKTVIQHFYDSHYQGADEVTGFLQRWRRLKGLVDDERYERIAAALEYQQGHAIVWRDAIDGYFLKLSGIPDEKGRAGHFPGRYEAESMTLDGYAPIDVTPWETAGGGKAVSCPGSGPCRASFTFDGASGTYDVRVRYFDLNTGASTFMLTVRGARLPPSREALRRTRRSLDGGGQPREVDTWKADDHFPTRDPNGHSSTWHVTHGVSLAHGDSIVVEGTPDAGEPAVLDYVEIVP